MQQIAYSEIPPAIYWLYNLILLVVYVYLAYKNKKDSLFCCIITAAFMGMFTDFKLENPMKIIMLGWSLWLFVRCRAFEDRKQQWIVLALITYSVYFVTDAILIHLDNPIMVISQLAKVFVPVCLFCTIVRELDEDEERANGLFNLFGIIMLTQIGFSVVKMVLIGGFLEGWVGSISGIRGGGAGTSLPLLGLLWLALASKMDLKNPRMWMFAIGLLVLGFAAAKRAVWLLFPALFAIMYLYCNRDKIMKAVTAVAVLLPIVLYFGLRLSPTLNPEKEVWGSFDPDYAYKYILRYSSGAVENSLVEGADEVQVGQGRMGALLWLVEGEHTASEFWFGKGLEYFIYADDEDYHNVSYYGGINHRGSVTGVVRQFMTLGMINVILIIVMLCIVFFMNRNSFSLIVFIVIMYDFIFYNAKMMDFHFMFILSLSLFYFSKYYVHKTAIEG